MMEVSRKPDGLRETTPSVAITAETAAFARKVGAVRAFIVTSPSSVHVPASPRHFDRSDLPGNFERSTNRRLVSLAQMIPLAANKFDLPSAR
jgi:hypothetical protein